MKSNLRTIALIIFFGSLWGFSEIFIGSYLADQDLPYGIIMTGFFAMIFLTMSRLIYNQRGMQLGIGLTAGALKFFNPFAGYNICSAIAIMAEGLIFELIWNYFIKYDFSKFESIKLRISFGIFASYTIYVLGYIITQILTPIIYSSFYIDNLISFIPQILSKGLLAGFLGIISISLVISVTNIKLTLKNIIYYPTTIGVSLICWIIVLTNWYFFIS